MNYPVWDITTIGGGSLIALIAVLHVFISHLAVGGGLFLWLTDRTAVRQRDEQLENYVQRHTWFFLLLTMVFGGVSGVGIWFIIALVQPSATSALIHNFVFGWAIEWVFFVGEITALLVYRYRFHHLSERDRLRVAFLYFLFAWLSLAIINGILTFMLTPGRWLQTHEFWDGFFNPTYVPGLLLRSCMAFMLAGLFGYVTAVFTPDPAFRRRLMTLCSRWILYPVVGFIPAAIWYFYAVPPEVRTRSFVLNPQTLPFLQVFLGASLALFIGGIVQMRRSPLLWQRAITAVLLLIGLSWIGGFEYVREISRKPYIISGYMYDNAIKAEDVAALSRSGVLSRAVWTATKEATPENILQAGREVFRLECQACHTIDGIRNDIAPRVKGFSHFGIVAQLTGMGKLQDYMPPFVGTEQEKEALAWYLASEINRRDPNAKAPLSLPSLTAEPLPAFDRKSSDYVLLVWNDLGMHCLSDGDDWFSFLPPANTLEAQLIKRGDPPVLVRDSVELVYRVQRGFENPAAYSNFWKNAESLFGRKLPDNVGLFGKGLSGTLDYDSARGSFVAAGIPVVPYGDDGSYNPYPTFTVEARAKESGKVLMGTRVVAPVSSEIGCRNCHGGGWRLRNSGLADETAQNILAAHDRLNGTTLLALARQGKPQLCQSCHPDPVLSAEGKPGVTDFSAAMHGWHASYMPMSDSRSCAQCHPSMPDGNTRCLRDPHAGMGVECVDCHGSMAGDAVALLKREAAKPSAQRLMKALEVKEAETITERIAWHGETDCLNCHQDFQAPGAADGFNRWTLSARDLYRMRNDMAGVRCPACHGPTHALYPSHNLFNRDWDNVQPLQYSASRAPIGSNRSCEICHRKPMQNAIHHPNMERAFRNTQLLD